MKYRLLFIHLSDVFADGQNRHLRGSLFLTPTVFGSDGSPDTADENATVTQSTLLGVKRNKKGAQSPNLRL